MISSFLDAVNREIYLEHLIILIKILIFGTRYRFSYRMSKNRDILPNRLIVPPLYARNHSNLLSEDNLLRIRFCFRVSFLQSYQRLLTRLQWAWQIAHNIIFYYNKLYVYIVVWYLNYKALISVKYEVIYYNMVIIFTQPPIRWWYVLSVQMAFEQKKKEAVWCSIVLRVNQDTYSGLN